MDSSQFDEMPVELRSAGAEFASMAPPLFDHGKSVDRLLARMVQDVQADQSRVQVAVICA